LRCPLKYMFKWQVEGDLVAARTARLNLILLGTCPDCGSALGDVGDLMIVGSLDQSEDRKCPGPVCGLDIDLEIDAGFQDGLLDRSGHLARPGLLSSGEDRLDSVSLPMQKARRVRPVSVSKSSLEEVLSDGSKVE